MSVSLLYRLIVVCFSLELSIHFQMLRSRWNSQLSWSTVPGQASKRQFTGTQYIFLSPHIIEIMLYLNQWRRKNEHKNNFMTKHFMKSRNILSYKII